MANTLKIKRSATEGKRPVVADLQLGELAVNTYDGKLFLKRSNGINEYIVEVGGNVGYEVKNQTGATIPKGTVVAFAGTLGASGKLLATPYTANNSVPSQYVMGVVEHDILNGSEGFVIDHGKIYGLNTSAWTQGTVLYASSTVAGGLVSTQPQAPNNKITVAAVVHSHATNGILEVRVTLGSQLGNDELVELGTLAGGDTLAYNATAGRFENTQLKTINGNSILGSGNISISGGSAYTVKTANYTAASGDNLLANTSGGSFTITLPASPTVGSIVTIADAGSFATNTLTVARNGSTIEGLAEDVVLDISGVLVQFIYSGTTWQIYAQAGVLSGGGGGGSAIAVSDEGTLLTSGATSLNFTGSGVTASADGTAITINVSGGGGGTATYVVDDPVFLMPSQALDGQVVLLKAQAQSLLNDATIASIKLTPPSGVPSTISADTSGIASLEFTASGTVGTVLTVKAQAIDSLGNLSKEVTYTVTIGTSFVNKATITSPINLATGVGNGLVITTAAFASSGATDTLDRTEFEVRTGTLGGGTLVWSGTTTSGLSITVPDDSIPAGSTVYIRARHVGVTLGSGQWSDDTQITMAAVLPPSQYGAPYQGGFYAGQIKIGTSWYAIVVAPRSQETITYSYYNANYGTLSTQAKSITDGFSNTNELVANGGTNWAAASYCYNLNYAGYDDWYLPSLMELELVYRTLKPTTDVNSVSQIAEADLLNTSGGTFTGNGTNFPATTIPSRTAGTNYSNTGATGTYPEISSSINFQGFSVLEGFSTTTYWSSSGPSGAASSRENMAYFTFSNGTLSFNASSTGSATYVTTNRYVRPFRRVFLRSEA